MEEDPSNYATILVISFVILIILVVVMVCVIIICCFIQDRDFSEEDSLPNSFNILSRSQNQALQALRDSVKLADRRISDQLNL